MNTSNKRTYWPIIKLSMYHLNSQWHLKQNTIEREPQKMLLEIGALSTCY